MARGKSLTESLPTRMSPAERQLIKKAASVAKMSESRFLVTAALLLSDFGSLEELRAVLMVAPYLIDTRMAAVAQVRLTGNQLKLLRSELEAGAQVSPENLELVIGEAAAALQRLGATWRGRSAK
jgi:hypothetical protein